MSASQERPHEGGILRSRRSLRGADGGARPAIAPQQNTSTLERVLAEARETFAQRPLLSRDISSFFGDRGFAIKIAGDGNTSRASVSGDSTSRASVSSDSAKKDGARAITGLFVVREDGDCAVSGIVVDALDGFRVLVRPPPDVIRDDGAVAYCLRNIADYDVYRALDGTRITLYWVPRVGQWLMSTARSYDARGFRWIGARTYAEAFADALGREINWDALDKGEIYSFIFRHRDFHPLARDAPGVWQISGPALDGIAQYKPLARADIPSAERMRFAAARAFSMCATAGEVFYGYIFRARSGDDTVEKQPRASPAAVFLESTLHAFVREGMYDIPPHVTGLTWETRPIYLHLRAYMAIGSAHAHVAMFPRAESVYSRMDYILSMLTDITVAEMRATRGRAGGARVATREQSEIGESLFGGAWARVYAAIARIAVTVARHLVETGAIGAFGDHVRANVRDQYMNKENMPEFMGILAMK